MGFRRLGEHRSKDVALWGQGDIRIVVNCDKEASPTATISTTARPSARSGCACRMPAATVARATALARHPLHAGAVGPGELDIPAVRGLGGGLLYFLDQRSALGRWSEVGFRADRSERVTGAGLLAVDHVSQTMQYEEMLTWLLFYTSLSLRGRRRRRP